MDSFLTVLQALLTLAGFALHYFIAGFVGYLGVNLANKIFGPLKLIEK